MKVECITFDLDDTLWAVGPAINRAEETFYAWLEQHYPTISLRYTHEQLIEHRREYFREFPELGHDLTGLRKQWLAHIAKETGHAEDLVEPAFRVFWEGRNAVELYPHASESLSSLKARYCVGAITNGNADVDHIGIGHLFDFVVTSERAGVAKPAPEIFELALESANVEPGSAVHVGDDPKRDVLAAKAVGMRSIWFNPDFDMWPGGDPPDAVVRCLSQLANVLDHW